MPKFEIREITAYDGRSQFRNGSMKLTLEEVTDEMLVNYLEYLTNQMQSLLIAIRLKESNRRL